MNSAVIIGARTRQLIEEALADLKDKGFDFGALSVDEEGDVYALNVFYAGPCTNNWNEGLWPHSSSLASVFGVGLYCLMCWGGPDDKNPTRVCAYMKYKAGWADTVVFLNETGGAFQSRAGANEFFVFRRNSTEYFILENRQRQLRDSSLTAAGLAIWHVDEQGSNDDEDMTPAKHYECSLEQADKRWDLEHRQNLGDAGEPF